MTSATPAPAPATDEDGNLRKRAWVEPGFVELKLADAEAGDGSGPDAGMIAS